uniref:Cytoskeleton-associated protein 2 n=1 Tax=Magallana gigas TaxID=29159 RepID=K1QG50_MAGGI
MEKINAAKVKKATDFLEKWKKFQDEKGQRRVSLATKPSPQDGNELKKKAGKKVVTSRYLSHKTEPNVLKQTTAQTKPSNPQKRISILPQPRPNGTPMSLSDEMMLPESEALKMPGHNVRFISPILPHPEHQSFRKTPNRLVHRSMRSELEEWLKKRGKTPSGFRHLRCFDATLSAKKKSSNPACNTEKESENVSKPLKSSVVLNLEDQFCAEDSMNAEDPAEEDLDSMLEECSTLVVKTISSGNFMLPIQERTKYGCPLEDTMKWLDSIEENIDIAKTSARFYICKARILKSTNDLEEVLHVFEKAVKNCAQPADELAMSLTQIITEISLERERKARIKSALTKEVEDGNVFDSSAIKKRLSGAHNDLEPSPCKMVTPVRRSTRRSLSSLPEQLQDRTPVYRALEDIPSPDRKSTLFLSNPALGYLLDEEGAL